MTTARAVGTADIPMVAALHGECFPEDPWNEAAITEVLAMPGAFGFLAASGEEPVGFLLALDLGVECEIVALGVRPAARRRGHAVRLLARFIEVAADRPARLEVAEDNSAALALYRGAGFRPAGRRPAYYRRPNGTAVGALLLNRLQKS